MDEQWPEVATSAEAVARLGSRERLRTAHRRGELRPIWRGVHASSRLTSPRRRLAAAAALSPHALLSGPSAARAHGFEVPQEWTDEITIPAEHPPVRPRQGLRVVARALPTADRATVAGLPTTGLARTVADLACRSDLADAGWVVDQALRRGLRSTAVEERLRPGQRGCRRARLLLRHGSPLSESALESRVRREIVVAGLEVPTPQFVVTDAAGRFVARVDLAWPASRVVVEADGLAWHAAPDALLHDRHRQNALTALGWLVLRCTWADVVPDPTGLLSTLRTVLTR